MADSRYLKYASNPKPGDYKKVDPATRAGMREIQGDRPTQEDKIIATWLDGFQKLTATFRIKVLQRTFQKMQEKYKKERSGSTIANAIAWIEDDKIHAVSAHLGDSEVHLVIIEDQAVISHERLTKNFHHPDSLEEKTRIEQHGSYVAKHRVKGKLAVSRSIGDYGVLSEFDHEVDINFSIRNITQNQKAFFVLACDGLMEKMTSRPEAEKKLAEMTAAYYKHLDIAAEWLVAWGYEMGSADNISVCVVPITSSVPISAAIFDGHGGGTVSAGLAKDFYPRLTLEIQKLLSPALPFVVAASSGDAATVRMLMPTIEDINTPLIEGETALYGAAVNGHLEVIELLLTAGADANALGNKGTKTTPLHAAAFGNHLAIVNILLAHGANPNLTNSQGVTALTLAAYAGHLNVVKRLLREPQIDLNRSEGEAALRFALTNHHIEVAVYLVEQGASVLPFIHLLVEELRHAVGDNKIRLLGLLAAVGDTQLEEKGEFEKLSDELKEELKLIALIKVFNQVSAENKGLESLVKRLDQLINGEDTLKEGYVAAALYIDSISLAKGSLFNTAYNQEQQTFILILKKYLQPTLPHQNLIEQINHLKEALHPYYSPRDNKHARPL